MTRMKLLEVEDTEGRVRQVLEGVQRKRGHVPTPVQVMAHSTATLEGYMGLAGALTGGVLDVQMRERIAIAIAAANGCQPCLAAHSKIGTAAGLSADEVEAARSFTSAVPRAGALLAFTKAVHASNGHVTDAQMAAAREAGITEAEMVEIAGHIVLNLLTNAVNSMAGVKVTEAGG